MPQGHHKHAQRPLQTRLQAEALPRKTNGARTHAGSASPQGPEEHPGTGNTSQKQAS